jgi:hypothetical protein
VPDLTVMTGNDAGLGDTTDDMLSERPTSVEQARKEVKQLVLCCCVFAVTIYRHVIVVVRECSAG